MSAEIKEYISACEMCRKLDTTSQAEETLMSHEVPFSPWVKIAAYIFTLDGKDYVVTIAYYSNFLEIDRLWVGGWVSPLNLPMIYSRRKCA